MKRKPCSCPQWHTNAKNGSNIHKSKKGKRK